MSDKNERQPLVAVLKTSNTNSFSSKFRIIIVLNISLLSYFGIYYAVYPRNEWLQNKIQREIFPNQTVSVNKVCGEINQSDPNYDKHDTVQKITAKWNMYATMASKGATILTAFVYTAYTDCYGRRFLFILSAVSLFIQSGSIATIIYFDAHPVYLVIAESIYGLTGSSYGFLAAMYAYMADLTASGKERSTALFLSSASTYMGGAIGTFSVGFYIQRYGYFYPALTAASFQLVLLLLSVFIIPESHSAERRIASPPFFSVIKRPFVFYASADFKRVRCGFILLLIAFAFVDMTITHRKTLETLYQLSLPFCWKPTQIALFATAVSVGENIFGLGSMKLLQRYVKDINIALISAVTNAGSLVVEGLAKTSFTMFLATIPCILNNLATPLIRSTMSEMASDDKQGALFASIILVSSICSFVASITDNSVYAATLEVFNGFIFITLAGYCGITIIFLSIFICRSKGQKEIPYQIQEKKGVCGTDEQRKIDDSGKQ